MLTDIIFDIVLIAILLFGIFIGAKRGFIGTIAKPVRLASSLFLSVYLCENVGLKIVKPIISAPITSQITDIINQKYSEITAATSGNLPTVIKLAAGLAGIDLQELGVEGDNYVEALINMITDPIVTMAATVIAFVGLFVLLMIVLRLALWIINMMIDNGFVGVMNRIIGCIFTFSFALVIVWALASVTEFVFNIPAFAEMKWVQEFNGGFVYRFFKGLSPLEILLSF